MLRCRGFNELLRPIVMAASQFVRRPCRLRSYTPSKLSFLMALMLWQWGAKGGKKGYLYGGWPLARLFG